MTRSGRGRSRRQRRPPDARRPQGLRRPLKASSDLATPGDHVHSAQLIGFGDPVSCPNPRKLPKRPPGAASGAGGARQAQGEGPTEEPAKLRIRGHVSPPRFAPTHPVFHWTLLHERCARPAVSGPGGAAVPWVGEAHGNAAAALSAANSGGHLGCGNLTGRNGGLTAAPRWASATSWTQGTPWLPRWGATSFGASGHCATDTTPQPGGAGN